MHKKYNSEKQTMHNKAKQNDTGLFTSYDTQPGNEMGLLFYDVPKPMQGKHKYRIKSTGCATISIINTNSSFNA